MSLGVGRTVGRGAQRASSHVKRAIACSSSVEDIVNTVAITAIQAQAQG